MPILTRLGVAKKVGIFDLRTSKWKISYISGKGIYKKIFFSGHFDEIFISKVDFCKLWRVWGLRKKVSIFDLVSHSWHLVSIPLLFCRQMKWVRRTQADSYSYGYGQLWDEPRNIGQNELTCECKMEQNWQHMYI